jgi:transposase
VPEIRRLVLASVGEGTRRVFHLRWSRWRRAHQAVAQRCHRARRIYKTTRRCIPRLVPPARSELTDAEWERIRALLPPQRPYTGRPRHDHRTVLGGILWVLRTASPWREMPARFGKWNTAYVRYRLWRRQGLWSRLIDVLGPAALPLSTVTRGEVAL